MGAAVVRFSYLAAAVPFFAGGLFVAREPIGLVVRAVDAQLRITWERRELGETNLQIVDGQERQTIAVTPTLGSVTYQPRGGDVEVRLANGESHLEITRMVARDPATVEVVRREIRTTREQARQLRAAVRGRTRHVEQMQRAADEMLREVPEPPTKTEARWWR